MIRAVCGVARSASRLIDDVQRGLHGVRARAVQHRNRYAGEGVVVRSGVIAGGVIRSAHEAAGMICPSDAWVRTRDPGGFVDDDAAETPRHGHSRRVGGRVVAAALARTAATGHRKDITSDVAVGIEALANNLLLDPTAAVPEAREGVGDSLKLDRCSICH